MPFYSICKNNATPDKEHKNKWKLCTECSSTESTGNECEAKAEILANGGETCRAGRVCCKGGHLTVEKG